VELGHLQLQQWCHHVEYGMVVALQIQALVQLGELEQLAILEMVAVPFELEHRIFEVVE
jgi:hypothetical protein